MCFPATGSALKRLDDEKQGWGAGWSQVPEARRMTGLSPLQDGTICPHERGEGRD